MSLSKLLLAPVKLFRKDVISFLIIQRHDLGVHDDLLRYVAVKPTSSIATLREKVWHLLALPDFCDEIIILKRDGVEIPLTELRKGNDPHHPYKLEVWSPPPGKSIMNFHNHMLTMGNGNRTVEGSVTSSDIETMPNLHEEIGANYQKPQTISNETICMNKYHGERPNMNLKECKKSELSCRISTSSFLLKLKGGKSQDHFANILLQIQNDLTHLSSKLSNLENKITV